MKYTVAALKKAIENDCDDNQSAFANRCKVERTTLANDLSGNRKIPDDRFHQYLIYVTPKTRNSLIRARLHDLIPPELHHEIFSTSPRVRENTSDLPQFPATLSPRVRSAIEWLATEVADDPALEDILLLLCKRLGWDEKKLKY